jgi:hypothetical protein
VLFLWAKQLNAKDIHKEIFAVTVGSVCRTKQFSLAGKPFAEEEVEMEVRKWLSGFRRSGKAMGQVFQCW